MHFLQVVKILGGVACASLELVPNFASSNSAKSVYCNLSEDLAVFLTLLISKTHETINHRLLLFFITVTRKKAPFVLEVLMPIWSSILC